MAAHGRCDRGDVALMAGLLAGRTIAEAAAAAGISERTGRRRAMDPDFQARLQAAKGELLTATATALGAACARAVATLVDLLDAPTPAATRRAAAATILDVGLRLADRDVERRITAIEAALTAGTPR